MLLVVDESEDSTCAIEEVRQRPRSAGAKVLVLAVVPRHRIPPPPPPMLLVLQGDSRGLRDEAGHARALVESVVESLKTGGLEAEGKVRIGHAHAEILKEARERSADLIVIGSSRLSPLQRLLMGSDLASSLASSAPCSVEVIRGKREAAAA